nr:MAG TPA: hypothetical protein [Caudoviricetes sp.]
MKKYACSKCNGNCMGCWHADECNQWLDIEPYNPCEIYVDTASMELCKARHETPATDGAIFETEVNPLDVAGLETEAKSRLENLNIKKLDLYVTGLTVALIAVLNVARELNISVTLWHFNRENGDYYSQEVK